MDDATGVKVLEGRENLVRHRPELLFGIDVSTDVSALEYLIEVALRGVLHDYVEVLLV